MSQRILGAAWLGLMLATTGIAPAASPATNWTQGLFAESSHEFGPVPRGAKVRHLFVLTNRTASPVTIANVRVSCGCTSGISTPGPIAPGQAGVVEATMDTANFAGRKETALFVTLASADGKDAEVRLTVGTTILSDIVLNPGSIDFGSITRGVSPKRTLTIDRIGSPNWKAVRMISASRAIEAELVETVRSSSGVGYALTVTLKPEAPAGPLREEIRIVTNDPESPNVPILVTANVQGGGLQATPSTLNLGGAGAPGRFLVRAPKPFRILAIEGAGEGFEVAQVADVSRAAHAITVRYVPDANAPKGEVHHAFRVLTDLPDEAPLELTATVKAK